jgi:hypothetical protein
MGQGGTVLQGIQAALVEGMQGIEHRLVVAAQLVGNLGSTFAASAGKQHLAAAQHKGILGAQAALQRLPLLAHERADKNGFSHRFQDNTFSPILHD